MDNKVAKQEVVEEETTAQRPTTQPITTIKNDEPLFYGRKIIYADYTEDEMNEETITQILNDYFSIHLKNAAEIKYLEDYYRGYQPILSKTKDVRPTINNKVVENNAYFTVEFKKSYVFGEPIQYVQRGDIASQEVAILNSYMLAESKHPKDTELAESLYCSGIGHRMVLPDINEDSPFDIQNLDSKTTFCVYSSGLGHKKLFGCTYTKGVKDRTIRGSIYTKNGFYTLNKGVAESSFDVKYVGPHIMGTIPIIEYYLNKSRLGIIEIIMSILNALNRISSGDLDGLEQFVQSILVFVNQEIDKKDFVEMLELGAVEVSTADPSRPADIKQMINDLSHADTKILHDRLFNTALQIVGIPKMEDKASGGDTGQARLLGEGWTMADERAKQDEMFFKMCSKEELKIILMICRLTPNSGINTLTIKDVEQKFTRNKSDNFLVKSQGMMNQIQSGIAPEVAITTSGLYSDSNEVYNKTMEFYGGIENWIKLFVDKASKQLNDTKTEDADKQEGGKTLTAEDDKKSQV